MLELLQKYALRFAWLRKPVFYVLMAMVIVFAATMLFSGSETEDVLLIPAILLFVWFLLLFSFLNLFAHVPERVREGRLFARLFGSLKRGFYHLFAIAMVLITVAVVVTTYQMIMVWLYMYVL